MLATNIVVAGRVLGLLARLLEWPRPCGEVSRRSGRLRLAGRKGAFARVLLVTSGCSFIFTFCRIRQSLEGKSALQIALHHPKSEMVAYLVRGPRYCGYV